MSGSRCGFFSSGGSFSSPLTELTLPLLSGFQCLEFTCSYQASMYEVLYLLNLLCRVLARLCISAYQPSAFLRWGICSLFCLLESSCFTNSFNWLVLWRSHTHIEYTLVSVGSLSYLPLTLSMMSSAPGAPGHMQCTYFPQFIVFQNCCWHILTVYESNNVY